MTEPITLAHGFTQTARSWDHIAELLAEAGQDDVRAVDLPGHGASAAVEVDLWGCADHLVRHGSPGTFIGYSMGGRVCLHAALAHPDVVQRLVLIGATPGIEDEAERSGRRDADDDLAAHIVDVGVPDFIDEWLNNPLFAGLDSSNDQRSDRLRNTAGGLASSLRHAGTGTQSPLWNRLDEVRVPVLLLVGEHDAKFRAVADAMAERLPNVLVEVVTDAGHSVHLEQPNATVEAIVGWLTSAG